MMKQWEPHGARPLIPWHGTNSCVRRQCNFLSAELIAAIDFRCVPISRATEILNKIGVPPVEPRYTLQC